MGGGEFLSGNGRGRTSKLQTAAGLLDGDALTWWTEYIKDQEIVKSEMS